MESTLKSAFVLDIPKSNNLDIHQYLIEMMCVLVGVNRATFSFASIASLVKAPEYRARSSEVCLDAMIFVANDGLEAVGRCKIYRVSS